MKLQCVKYAKEPALLRSCEYHFGNKEKLIEQCIERMINGTVKRFQNIREKTDSFTSFEKLEYLSNMTLDFLFEHYAVFQKFPFLPTCSHRKEGDNTYRTYEAYLPIVAACRPDLDEAAIKRKTLYLITVMQQMFLRYEIISQYWGLTLDRKKTARTFLHKFYTTFWSIKIEYHSDKRNRETRCYLPIERDVFN